MKQKTLLDEENRLELLSQLGDPLEILNRVIKWEKFRSVLNQGSRKEDTGKGWRPSYDVVMMFKILVLQRLYNLSDDQTEYQINDRMSFMRFLGINLCDKVPDAKTIWKFKNDIAETETVVYVWRASWKRRTDQPQRYDSWRTTTEKQQGRKQKDQKRWDSRGIGITRAWMNIGITNLVYNFCRYSYLKGASAWYGITVPFFN